MGIIWLNKPSPFSSPFRRERPTALSVLCVPSVWRPNWLTTLPNSGRAVSFYCCEPALPA